MKDITSLYMRKVVIAIDSFKGSVTSREAGEAVRKGILTELPDCEVAVLPVSDGGEGLLEVFEGNVERRAIAVQGPLGREVLAHYCVLGDGKTALIEMAQAAGLPLLTDEERNPEETTTFGVGQLIAHAVQSGCRDFLIGIGGSATNDAGTGMLEALGFIFRNKSGDVFSPKGATLIAIAEVDATQVSPVLKSCRFNIACDVTNPFSGPQGAATVFSPQKGASAEMTLRLEAGMEHLHRLFREQYGIALNEIPGSGAAGGLGGAFVLFLHASLRSGAELLLDYLRFDTLIKDAQLLITGEGRMDAQTLMGKIPYRVMERASRLGIPTIALCGSVSDLTPLNQAGFTSLFSIHPDRIPLKEAMDKELTLSRLMLTAQQIIRLLEIL